MTRTISPAEHRAGQHENEARNSIEFADESLARAEREIMAEIERPGRETEFNRRWLVHYAAARRHLNAARDVLTPDR